MQGYRERGRERETEREAERLPGEVDSSASLHLWVVEEASGWHRGRSETQAGVTQPHCSSAESASSVWVAAGKTSLFM